MFYGGLPRMRGRSSVPRGTCNGGHLCTTTLWRAPRQPGCSNGRCDKRQRCAPYSAGVSTSSCWRCTRDKCQRRERITAESFAGSVPAMVRLAVRERQPDSVGANPTDNGSDALLQVSLNLRLLFPRYVFRGTVWLCARRR